ncbi:MAG TPA: hypothetical protein VMG12_36620 [Polyangiaceae bacterium]|nr:hypothetical protein [Polyangiaceae bacterium]
MATTTPKPGSSLAKVGRALGLSRWLGSESAQLARRASAGPQTRATRAAPDATSAKAPRRQQSPFSWSLARIRDARDSQARGQFELPVRLAEAMRTDDAIFTAYQARIATQSAVALVWRAAQTPGGPAALERARVAIKAPQHVRQSILGTLALHGVAIGYVEHSVAATPSGPTVAFTLTEWPLEHVRYVASDGTLETRVDDGIERLKITHGDGHWIVFSKFGVLPWTQDAALLPAALLWAAHAEGLADWAGASAAHGQPRIVGELPEGMPLGDGQGGLSPDARAYLDLLSDLINGTAAAGIRPFGAKSDYISNDSTAWQIFKELITNREGAAARIFLGTDAILGARGGAPGVDVAALFGIATTRIQGDFEALERGMHEGMALPWAALHGVEPEDMPRQVYELPDVDADKRSEQEAAAVTRLADAVDAMKRAGLTVDQAVINALVQALGVTVSCVMAARETKVVPLQLAPTDVARVVTVNEARASQGLPSLADKRGAMMISDLEREAEAGGSK